LGSLGVATHSPIKATLLLVATAFFATPLLAETFDNTRDGFSIKIPPDWQPIPESKVAEMHAAARKAHPGFAVPDFRYGYQARSDQWFSYPYVLVAVKRSGRAPEHLLAELAKDDFSAHKEKFRSSAGGLVSAFEMGKAVYDPSTRILWATSEITYPKIGKVGILTGCVQTEEGGIWVYGYALRDAFDSHKPTFAQITESVRPTEALRYKPRLTDRAPVGDMTDSVRGIDWGKAVGKGLVAGLAAGVLIFVIAVFAKIKSLFSNRSKPQ
jgi:hypothetical protein